MLISTGDRVQCGDYVLHSRFDRVINFVHEGRLASMVAESVGAGPLNLVFRGALPAAESVQIDERSIRINGEEHAFTARFRSTFRIDDWDPDLFYPNVETLHRHLLEQAPAESLTFLLDEERRAAFRAGFEQHLVQRVTEALHLIYAGRLLDGVRILSGCGNGLTPAGDDFIAGLLTARRMRNQMLDEPEDQDIPLIREAARSGNLIADSLIECAAAGSLCEPHLRLVEALVCGTEDMLLPQMDRVLGTGATSGADWLTGLCMTLMEDFDVTKKRGA